MSEPIIVDQNDVVVEPLELPDCDECGGIARHSLGIDLRGMGQMVHVGIYCDGCLEVKEEQLRECFDECLAGEPK